MKKHTAQKIDQISNFEVGISNQLRDIANEE